MDMTDPKVIQIRIHSKDFVVKRLTECMDYLQQRLSFDLSTLEYLSLKELNEELQNSISEIIDK